MKYLHQYVHLSKIIQLFCFRKVVLNANMVFLGHAKTINLDEGKIGKIEMLPANSLERILFLILEMNHLLVFSVHTSQSVLYIVYRSSLFVFSCLIAGYCKQCSHVSFHLGFGQDNVVALSTQ